MRTIAILVALVGLATLGCSGGPELKSAPVSITGKATKAGQPVGNVTVAFQPLDSGHQRSFTMKPDGTFAGELIAGNYAYFVEKPAKPTPADANALKAIDPKYFEADLNRSVAVEAGKDLALAFD
jgi:hypothetical protein